MKNRADAFEYRYQIFCYMGKYRLGDSPLLIKSRSFAVRITKMVDYLQRKRNLRCGYIYSQILRSGTSIMANISEAQFAQSQADFITKFHIALKEANETKNSLFLLNCNNAFINNEYESISNDCNEIIAILVASLNTSKNNLISKNITKNVKGVKNDKVEDEL